MISLDHDIAVVTGAAQGIGRAIAKGLATQGARLLCCDIQEEPLAELVEEITRDGGVARFALCNVAQKEECDAAASYCLQAFAGSASILVNGAGVIRRTPPDATNFMDEWDLVMAVNATGVVNMVRAFLPQLRENNGRVVNFGSIMSVVGGKGLAAYAASKGAVAQLTKSLAQDLASLGIRVNAIAPGVIETPMTTATRQNPEALGRFMAHTPLNRPGRPEELVGPVLFLASQASSYVTGILMPVDGGYLAA